METDMIPTELERDVKTAQYNEHTARQVLVEAVARRIEADYRLRRWMEQNPPESRA